MTRSRAYQVKDVARLSGVSVRTLHHYHSIGLLVPRVRTDAGYRIYSAADVLRLQQILIGRELGLSLEEIRRFLDDPRFDRRSALEDQRRRLKERARHTDAMIRAIEAALKAMEADPKGETKMDGLFEGFTPSHYEDEARQRWGSAKSFDESIRRTNRYTADEWNAIKAEQAAIHEDAYAALRGGKRPSDDAVMDIAERHRESIDRWFYRCTYDIHRGLAMMYESDERFRRSIDSYGQGLTAFLAAAIRANAVRSSRA